MRDTGRTRVPSVQAAEKRLRIRCARNPGGHSGDLPRVNGLGGTRISTPLRQQWQRSAVALDGVEVDKDRDEPSEPADSSGWGGQNEDENVSYARMLKFILPTLGIWLASPIMSLVDAGVVGEQMVPPWSAKGYRVNVPP